MALAIQGALTLMAAMVLARRRTTPNDSVFEAGLDSSELARLARQRGQDNACHWDDHMKRLDAKWLSKLKAAQGVLAEAKGRIARMTMKQLIGVFDQVKDIRDPFCPGHEEVWGEFKKQRDALVGALVDKLVTEATRVRNTAKQIPVLQDLKGDVADGKIMFDQLLGIITDRGDRIHELAPGGYLMSKKAAFETVAAQLRADELSWMAA